MPGPANRIGTAIGLCWLGLAVISLRSGLHDLCTLCGLTLLLIALVWAGRLGGPWLKHWLQQLHRNLQTPPPVEPAPPPPPKPRRRRKKP